MTIKDLPIFYDMPFTTKEGKVTSDGYFYLDQQFQVLNDTVFSVNATVSTLFVDIPEFQPPLLLQPINAPAVLGLNPPSYTTVQITAIMAKAPEIIPVGTIWYNSTLKKLQFKSDVATIETITSV